MGSAGSQRTSKPPFVMTTTPFLRASCLQAFGRRVLLRVLTHCGGGTLTEAAATNIIAERGRLYNWYAVNTGKLCPSGCHVPTRAEFAGLFTILGRDEVAGQKLKASSTDSPAWDGTNTIGWMGLPGGLHQASDGFYSLLDDVGAYWTSESTSNQGSYRNLYDVYSGLVNRFPESTYNKTLGLCVRCILNVP